MRAKKFSSSILSLRIFTSTWWSKLSKQAWISPSTNHVIPVNWFCICCKAEWQLLLGLNPWEQSEKFGSYILSRIIFTTSCTNLSSVDGIPNGRFFVLFFFYLWACFLQNQEGALPSFTGQLTEGVLFGTGDCWADTMKKAVPFIRTPPHHLQTSQGARVAPQRCLILHLRKSNYILIDYWPEFNRLGKGLEELLPPLFLQW